MYDQQLLKEKYGFSADTYGGGWANYLKAKVKLSVRMAWKPLKWIIMAMEYTTYIRLRETANLM